MDRFNRFEGKVALITGASRGIGRGIALHLAAAGADVVVNYYSHAEEAQQVAEEIGRLGRRALVYQADVAEREAVQRMFDAAVKYFGHIDIVVANAVFERHAMLVDADWEVHRRVFEVTQFGVYHTCQFAARQMVRQSESGRPGGKIIIIGSVCAEVPFAGQAAYNMAKAAVHMLGRSLAAELTPYHINVNVIAPGWIDTPGERAMYGDAVVDAGWQRVPWRRLGTPEDIAKAVAYLASDDADFVTGTTLVVDGGQMLYLGSPDTPPPLAWEQPGNQ
ncbi:MAG: NAD(P)-dependent oxidoreductase [Ardenticatenia bacterium]|jgi:glucose 1-dehydrogenase|nr:MAG: NAD(P)-dependent oxidoreductase [Ardenticatenia bacterium]